MAVRLPSYSKIDFLVDRKFPTYRESLRFLGGRHLTVEPEVEEMHKTIVQKAEQFRDELKSMPEEEVDKLYIYEKKQEKLEQEQEEREQFYNQPILTDDLIFWVKKLTWSLEEAISLSFDRDPREVSWNGIDEFWPKSPFVKQYDQRRKIVLSAKKVGHLKDPIEPDKFTRWCLSEQIELPANLVRLIEERSSRLASSIEEDFESIGANEKVKVEKPAVANQAARNEFRFTGEHWSITFQGQAITLKNTKGIRYIAHLIQNQGKEFSIYELYFAINPPDVDSMDLVDSNMTPENLNEARLTITSSLSDSGESMDEQAKSQVLQQIQVIENEIEIAKETGATEKLTQLENELEPLALYLAAGLGLHGRPRSASSDLKRKSDSVKICIRRDLKKINTHLPILGKHLKRISYGSTLSYSPDSLIEWAIDVTPQHQPT